MVEGGNAILHYEYCISFTLFKSNLQEHKEEPILSKPRDSKVNNLIGIFNNKAHIKNKKSEMEFPIANLQNLQNVNKQKSLFINDEKPLLQNNKPNEIAKPINLRQSTSDVNLNNKIKVADKLEKPFLSHITSLKSNNKSFSDNTDGLIEGFFIAGLSKEKSKFIPQSEGKYSHCNHSLCSKLPGIEPDIIFRYPAEDTKTLEINSFMASIFYPKGMKMCYSEDENLIKNPIALSTSITNQQGERYYLQSKQVYHKIQKKQFEKEYSLNLNDEFIQIEKMLELFKEKPELSKYYETMLEAKLEIITELNFRDYIYIPVTFVLITKQPFLNELTTFLNYFIKCCIETKENFSEEMIFDTLIHLNKEVPLKPSYDTIIYTSNAEEHKNKGVIVNFFIPSRELITIDFNKDDDYPPIPNNTISLYLTEHFKLETIIEIFYLIKTEQKLLFHSSIIEKIPKIIFSFLGLLFPLEWTNTLIPLLSLDMIKYTQSFMPYLMGIETALLSNCKEYLQENTGVYIIDIDNGKIVNENREILYPMKIYNKILERIEEVKISAEALLDNFTKRRRRQCIRKSNNTEKSFLSIKEEKEKSISLLYFLSNITLNKKYTSTSDLNKQLIYKSQILNLDVLFRNAFINSNFYDLEDHEKFLSFMDNVPLFSADNYISSKKTEDQKYFEAFTSTQIFSVFLQKQRKPEKINLIKAPISVDISSIFSNEDYEEGSFSNNLNLDDEINKTILLNNAYPIESYDNYYINPFFLKDSLAVKMKNKTFADIYFEVIKENTSVIPDIPYICEILIYPSQSNLIKKISALNNINKYYLPYIMSDASSNFKSTLLKLEKICIEFKNKRKTSHNKIESIININDTKEALTNFMTNILTSYDLTNEDKSNFENVLNRPEALTLFPKLIYQTKFNEGTMHFLSNNAFKCLKMAINIYFILIDSSSKPGLYQNEVRLITKSLFYYYKLSNKSLKVFLSNEIKKSNSKLWTNEAFWIFFLESEIKENKIKQENEIFAILLKFLPYLFELQIDLKTIYLVVIDKLSTLYIKNEKTRDLLKTSIVKLSQIS